MKFDKFVQLLNYGHTNEWQMADMEPPWKKLVLMLAYIIVPNVCPWDSN